MSWWRRFRYAWANAGHVLLADCLALNAKLAILERERNHAVAELNKRADATGSAHSSGLAIMLRHRETAQLMLERDTETQRADEAERKLARALARIRELEAGAASPAETTLVMPRTRSLPPPGVGRGW